MRHKSGLILLQFVFGLILFLIFLPALATSPALKALSGMAYLLFDPFCHQLAGRSFHVNDVQLAVCARCTGVYLGLFMGGLIFMVLKKPMPKVMLLPLALLAVDGLLNFAGIIGTPALVRFGIGLCAGMSGGWLLGFGVSDLEEMLREAKAAEWKTGNIT
jgi:uncharacterized membrane protein